MSDTPKVSVIIPVYNVEPYLRQCMDSVVGQTLREIEILCVNDGSTDVSPDILREYAGRDGRIRLLSQHNQGSAAARNRAIEQATGEYLICWDSDDYFEPDALEQMYTLAKRHDADLCLCNAQDFDDLSGKKLAHSYLRKPYPETDYFCWRDCPDRIFEFTSTVCWNKMVRRRFLLDNDIRYQEAQYIEDTVAAILMLTLAKRIVLCKKKLVYYRVNRSGSQLANYGEQPEAIIRCCEETYDILARRDLLQDEVLRQSLFDKFAGLYFRMAQHCGSFTQFEALYRGILAGDSLLARYQPQEPVPRYLQMYRDTKEQSAGEYLFRRFRTLTEANQELRAEAVDVKKKRKKLAQQLDETRSALAASEAARQTVTEELVALEQRLADAKCALNAAEAGRKHAELALAEVRRSRAFRLGRLLTWLPRNICERLRKRK